MSEPTLVRWARARLDGNECDQGGAPPTTCEGCAFIDVCPNMENTLENAIIALFAEREDTPCG